MLRFTTSRYAKKLEDFLTCTDLKYDRANITLDQWIAWLDQNDCDEQINARTGIRLIHRIDNSKPWTTSNMECRSYRRPKAKSKGERIQRYEIVTLTVEQWQQELREKRQMA